MLIDALVAEFDAYFKQDADRDTILWFDPDREWQGLLPHLAERLPLLVYTETPPSGRAALEQAGVQIVYKSQLKVRYLLARRDPGTRLVVYLPLEMTQARFLRPYFFTAKHFSDSIEKVLSRQKNISLPNVRVLRRIRPLLPGLAVASVDKGVAFWRNLATYQAALGQLFPNWDETLLRFLSNPQRTRLFLNNWQQVEPFFDLIELEFGMKPPLSGQDQAWIDRFTARLCLVEVFDPNPGNADFPFLDILPDPVHRPRHRSFLRQWQHHDLFRDSFRRLAKGIDAQYALGNWVVKQDAAPSGDSFLNVERALWEQTRQQLAALPDKTAAVEFARRQRGFFTARARGFWAREGEVPGWQVLQCMADTILGARQALDSFAACTTPVAMIEQYTANWWRVDADYRRFLAEIDQSNSDLDAARKWTGRCYQDYLEQINGHFTGLIAAQAVWPPAGATVGATDFWPALNKSYRGRRAIILVDALRYELAQALAKRLELPAEKMATCLSPVPSITEVGMAALLPGWPDFQVDYAGRGWQITAPDGADNLARKEHRLAWLVQHLGAAAVFDLDQWLATSFSDLDETQRWIVITSSAIDAVGEGAGQVAVHTFDSLLGRLEQGVRRLQAADCTDIYIVTDHGFLLRESVRDAEKVRVTAEGVLKKKERYLIGRQMSPDELPQLPVSGSSDLVARFPRGVGCFVTPGPYNYMHGGIALQEVVTARLHLQQTVDERLVDVKLDLVDGSEIRNAFFKVRLTPQNVDLLSKARQVEIDILRDGDRVSRVWEARVERDQEEKTLILEPDYGLSLGDRVSIRVRDKTTHELLAVEAATVEVDLEF